MCAGLATVGSTAKDGLGDESDRATLCLIFIFGLGLRRSVPKACRSFSKARSGAASGKRLSHPLRSKGLGLEELLEFTGEGER